MKRYAMSLVIIFLPTVGCSLNHKGPETFVDSPDAIRLKARVFVPKAGLHQGLKDYFAKGGQAERVHVLVQFRSMPEPGDRKTLEQELGMLLLDPVPERAFFAAVPPDMSLARKAIGDGQRVGWIGVIEPRHKVAPWLLQSGIPEHARNDRQMAELIVQFFGDVPIVEQEAVLARHDAKSLTRIEPLNGWRVFLNDRSLLRLAEEDSVKWIEEMPAPPEDDNDGVRSASGVHANDVLPTSAYNLTGNGVKVAQWEETHASLFHGDFLGRIVVGDGLVPPAEQSHRHNESVAADGVFADGEGIYRDIDDSGNVSVGDFRATRVGSLLVGLVVAGNSDLGTALVFFQLKERFRDTLTPDKAYTVTGPNREAIYFDTDNDGTVSLFDTRLTAVPPSYLAGSSVFSSDSDVGQSILSFPTNPHAHSTLVAGTLMGSGAQSAAQGGSANQWKGVAGSANLRSYSGNPMSVSGSPVPADEYVNASNNGATISNNSWGTGHCHQVSGTAPNTCYEVGSQYYDAVISGRRSDGSLLSSLLQPVLILGSAGDEGAPERHSENGTPGKIRYDHGEAIYLDVDDSGTVSAVDVLRTAAATAQPMGTALVNFNMDEMHTDAAAVPGSYDGSTTSEWIYSDVDGSRSVTAGDVRVSTTLTLLNGTTVPASTTADLGQKLRQFMLWGNVRIPNSAKDTIEVANIDSGSKGLAPTSSRGPTDDGRVKPDLAGPGSQVGGDGGVTSTFPGNLYTVAPSGTSMSTPAVSGCAALATEFYKNACVAVGPTPDTLKALLIHGAEDLTAIPNVPGKFDGPDFAYGFGRARAKESVDLLPYHRKGTVSVVGDTDYTVTVGKMGSLRATLVWSDPPWSAGTAPSIVTGLLHNDLDLLLIAPDGTQYTPWLANGANPFAPATRLAVAAGSPIPPANRDRRNTVEQVEVPDAMAGDWTIRVTASTLNPVMVPQSYTVVSEMLLPQAGGPCVSTPAADVWMKDNPADTGVTPSTGTMWVSPDVWNRRAADGATAHENPKAGVPNYLYANIRNVSVTAQAVGIDFWLAPASSGLAWPASFTYVGRIFVPNLAPGVLQVGPLEWVPPPPTPSDHFCFYVRVASPQDPITLAETSSVNTNTQNSNNIVWRNIHIVTLSSRGVTFVMRNIEQKDAEVDLVVRIPPEFLNQGRAFVRLSPELEKRWPESNRRVEGLVSLEERYRVTAKARVPRPKDEQPCEGDLQEPEERPTPLYQLKGPEIALRGFRMGPQQAETVRLTFQSDKNEKASYDIEVIQRIDGRTVGGNLYQVQTGHGHNE